MTISSGGLMAGLEGARIVHVEALDDPFKWVLVFEHRGTDDGSGYLIVDGPDVHFNMPDDDPDAWKELLERELCAHCPGTDDPGCCQGDAADALGQAMEP